MTVRGGKNRVLVYTGAGLLLVALVLFYHNAATKLEDARVKYEKCHLNEESQSAQLQGSYPDTFKRTKLNLFKF